MARSIFFLLPAVLSLLLRDPPASPFSFSYLYHGEDWAWGHCYRRESQSPIDFDGTAPWGFSPDLLLPGEDADAYWRRRSFFFNYELLDADSDVEYSNNGHSLNVNFAGNGLGGITFEGGWYNLVSMTLHVKGEHTFRGRRPPMEVHFVHKKYDSEALVVVAVPITDGDDGDDGSQLSDFLGVLRAATPKEPNLEAETARPGAFRVRLSCTQPFDLNGLFTDGAEFFQYRGSLTVPPCQEIATWMVRKKPVKIASFQRGTRVFRDMLREDTAGNGNWRSTMPLAGRPVYLVKGVRGEPSGGEGAESIAKVKVAPFQGVSEGREATRAAGDAVNAANSLGWGLIKSSASVGRKMEQVFGLDHYVAPPNDGKIQFGAPTTAGDASEDTESAGLLRGENGKNKEKEASKRRILDAAKKAKNEATEKILAEGYGDVLESGAP